MIFTVGYAVGREVGVRRTLASLSGERAQATPPAAGEEKPVNRVVVSYFHSTKRCKKCNTIEAYAKEALETTFPEEQAAGTIAWRTANMDDVWNADAVRRYELVRSSLVLVDERDGSEYDHVVLHRTWELTDDKETFIAYVESEVEMILDAWGDDDETEE